MDLPWRSLPEQINTTDGRVLIQPVGVLRMLMLIRPSDTEQNISGFILN